MDKTKDYPGTPAGILDEDLEEHMSEKKPFDAAIKAIEKQIERIEQDYSFPRHPDDRKNEIISLEVAIRVLEDWAKWKPLIEAAEKIVDRIVSTGYYGVDDCGAGKGKRSRLNEI